jgi:hypothetical protein
MIDVDSLISDSANEAHSRVVLTYEFDLVLYDGLVRRRLVTAGARNQLVMCDMGIYERELQAVSVAPRLGHDYTVSPIQQGAASQDVPPSRS